MMEFPKDLLYMKSHEWVKFLDDKTALVGISDHAQSELGDLVFVNLPQPDDMVTAGEPFADVESVKAVSDVYSPVTGTVVEINEALLETPELLNQDPYGAWMIKVAQVTDQAELLSAEDYEKLIAEEA